MTYSKLLHLILLTSLFSLNAKGQYIDTTDCLIDIHIEKYNIYIRPTMVPVEITEFDSDSTFYYKFQINSCKGELSVQKFDRKNNLLEKGNYSGSLDTLKKYVNRVEINPPFSEYISILKYFEPVQDGKWFYYLNNKINREEMWRKGILLN